MPEAPTRRCDSRPFAALRDRLLPQPTKCRQITPIDPGRHRTGSSAFAAAGLLLVSCKVDFHEAPASEHSPISKIADSTAEHDRQRDLPTFSHDPLNVHCHETCLPRACAASDAEEQFTVLRLHLRPPSPRQHRANALLGLSVPCDRLGVATETVVFRVRNEACAYAVQVNVGGHRLKGACRRFDQYAFEAFSPKCTETLVRSVEPDRKPLL